MSHLVTYNRPLKLDVYNRIGNAQPFSLVLDDGQPDSAFEAGDPVVGSHNIFLGTILVPLSTGGTLRMPIIRSGLPNQVFLCIKEGTGIQTLEIPRRLKLEDLDTSSFPVDPSDPQKRPSVARAIEMPM